MKKVIIVCDKCGKQIDDADVTLRFGTEEPMEFCAACGKRLKMALSTHIQTFLNTPEPEGEPKPLPRRKKTERADIDMPKVFALRRAGWSWQKIGDEFGVTDSTVINHVRAYQEEHKDDDDTV